MARLEFDPPVPTRAEAPSLSRPASSAPSRRPSGVVAGVLVLVLLAVAGVLLAVARPWTGPAPDPARDASGPGRPTPTPAPTPTPTSVPTASVAPASFRVSSFNVLGAGHTRAGGTRPRFAAGRVRMRWAVQLLRSADVSVAGLQELEPPQYATFRRAAPRWGVFPGVRPTRRYLANSVVWDRRTWRLVAGRTVVIPYFHGRPKPMPYVLLRHRATGRRVWFANFHNPADVRGPAAQWRREAVARETGLVNRLAARGLPVVMTGDMNDRATFFCPVVARTPLHAANGGSRRGRCRPPPGMGIDWILGSPQVVFTHHRAVRGGLVARTTDHPFVWAAASVGAAPGR